MELSIAIPVYDDSAEAAAMVEAARQSFVQPIDAEFLFIDLHQCGANLPAAKNQAAARANGEYILFLYPGIFPAAGAIDALVSGLRRKPDITAVGGRWSNAKGKLEIGYNVRRFPTLTALVLDILLLNKVFPRNRWTRHYKMHDFDHKSAILVEHTNDCVFLIRRDAIHRLGGFDEGCAPGWFDQLEFCQSLREAGKKILFEPEARFVSNERVPLIDRLVEDHYPEYRRTECAYIRKHFGQRAFLLARACIALGMLQRIAFSLLLPVAARKWLLSLLRSYVNDDYIRDLRTQYWMVLKESIISPATDGVESTRSSRGVDEIQNGTDSGRS